MTKRQRKKIDYLEKIHPIRVPCISTFYLLGKYFNKVRASLPFKMIWNLDFKPYLKKISGCFTQLLIGYSE